MGKKEIQFLSKIAKKVVNKSLFKKVRKVKDAEDKLDVLRHSIKSSLDSRLHELEKAIKKSKKEGKDVFFAEMKFRMLKTRVRMFCITFDKKDFNNLLRLFNEVPKEMKNV